MKWTILLLLLLSTVSCSRDITITDWERAERKCETNGGVEKIIAPATMISRFLYSSQVRCDNGAYFIHPLGSKPTKSIKIN